MTMPKEDDIDNILNSLDHLLKEGTSKKEIEADDFDELGEAAEPLTAERESPADQDVPATGTADKVPLWVLGSDGDAEEALGEEPLATDEPESVEQLESGPKRIMLTSEMLDKPGPVVAPAAPVAIAADDSFDDLPEGLLEEREPDQAWSEEQESEAVHPLQDKEARAFLAQQVATDVSMHLADELPRLIEEYLNERLAEIELNADSQQ